MENTIKEYIDDLPEKLNSNKTISLYELIKKSCPGTIRILNTKIYGQNAAFIPFKEEKWYTSIINYLVKKQILETEKTDIGTFHNVSENYTKYFLVPKSTVYSLNNKKKHLMLYAQTSHEFLKATGLYTKENKEFLYNIKKENNFFDEKTKKIIKIITIFVCAYTILQYLILFSKYGFQNMIPITLNSLIFTITMLILVK